MQLKNKKKYFGIGLSLLYKSMTFLGISKKLYVMNNNILMSELLDQKFDIFLKNTFILDIKLRDKIFIDIRKLIVLNSYKGLRHEFSLPVNGQRTKTNARTNKNKRGNKIKSKYKKK